MPLPRRSDHYERIDEQILAALGDLPAEQMHALIVRLRARLAEAHEDIEGELEYHDCADAGCAELERAFPGGAP